MEITFAAESIQVESGGRNFIEVTVNADGNEIAKQLSDKDRLEGMDVDVVAKWLISEMNNDDILEYIGLDKIHEYLSHGE